MAQTQKLPIPIDDAIGWLEVAYEEERNSDDVVNIQVELRTANRNAVRAELQLMCHWYAADTLSGVGLMPIAIFRFEKTGEKETALRTFSQATPFYYGEIELLIRPELGEAFVDTVISRFEALALPKNRAHKNQAKHDSSGAKRNRHANSGTLDAVKKELDELLKNRNVQSLSRLHRETRGIDPRTFRTYALQVLKDQFSKNQQADLKTQLDNLGEWERILAAHSKREAKEQQFKTR